MFLLWGLKTSYDQASQPDKELSDKVSISGSVQLCWLMAPVVGWHIRDKLRPVPKHGSTLIYFHRNRKIRLGWRAQDGHLDSHTAPELCVYSNQLAAYVHFLSAQSQAGWHKRQTAKEVSDKVSTLSNSLHQHPFHLHRARPADTKGRQPRKCLIKCLLWATRYISTPSICTEPGRLTQKADSQGSVW